MSTEISDSDGWHVSAVKAVILDTDAAILVEQTLLEHILQKTEDTEARLGCTVDDIEVYGSANTYWSDDIDPIEVTEVCVYYRFFDADGNLIPS